MPLKPRLGPLAYGVGAARAATTGGRCRPPCAPTAALCSTGAVWQVVVVSGAFGAGSGVAEADPDDGVLDVVVLPAGSRVGLARRAWGLRTRTIAQQRDVPHERGAVVEVDLAPGTDVNADGELRVGGLERVTVTPRAFRLVVGASPRPRARGRGCGTAAARPP